MGASSLQTEISKVNSSKGAKNFKKGRQTCLIFLLNLPLPQTKFNFFTYEVEMSKEHENTPSTSTKRHLSAIEEEDGRPMCKYGEKCYRKNPQHFIEYQHPGKINGYYNSLLLIP